MTIASDLLKRHFQTLVDDNAQWQTLIADDILWELAYAPAIGHPARRTKMGSGLAIQHLASRGGDLVDLVHLVFLVCLVRRTRETRQTRAPDRPPLNRPHLTQRSLNTAVVVRCTTNEWTRPT
jgi:hypothetical protein